MGLFGVLFLLDVAGCFFMTRYNLFLASVPTILTVLFPLIMGWLALPEPGSAVGQKSLSPGRLGTSLYIFRGSIRSGAIVHLWIGGSGADVPQFPPGLHLKVSAAITSPCLDPFSPEDYFQVY